MAGFDQREEFTTEALAPDQAAEATRCVTTLFASQPAAGVEEPVGADMLRYEIEIENGDEKFGRISIIDDGSQPTLGALLQAVGM